jgi:hypothetical protein
MVWIQKKPASFRPANQPFSNNRARLKAERHAVAGRGGWLKDASLGEQFLATFRRDVSRHFPSGHGCVLRLD